MTELEGYIKGGLEPLHYGGIKYLPCYAAAGSRVTLGLFNDIGKVGSKGSLECFHQGRVPPAYVQFGTATAHDVRFSFPPDVMRSPYMTFVGDVDATDI